MISTSRACLGVERPGHAVGQQMSGLAHRRERRAQLVREDREELFLHFIHLAQPRWPCVEGAGRHASSSRPPMGIGSRNEPAADGGGRLPTSAPHRARDPERDDRGRRSASASAGGQRDATPVHVRAPAGPPRLRAHHARVRRLLRCAPVHLHLLGHSAPDRVHHRVPIAPQPRMLLDHRRAIALEGLGGRGQVRLLALGVHAAPAADRDRPRPVGRLAPERRRSADRSAPRSGPSRASDEHRVAHARAQTERGH